MDATDGEKQRETGRLPTPTAGITAFIVRILEQLSLSAWLPAAFFTTSLALLVRFRANHKADIGLAIQDITTDPVSFLVLLVPLLVVATMVTQAFSFLAIRTLEGYWREWGPSSFCRSVLIRRQLHRKNVINNRIQKETRAAFSIARPRMLEASLGHPIVNYLESCALGTPRPSVSAEEKTKLRHLSWRIHCDPWRLAKIDSLLREQARYPQKRRVLPTKLGNVLRTVEDSLSLQNEDMEGWVIRRKHLIPLRLQVDHDHFRTRLDMYAILVFISGFMTILTPFALVGQIQEWWPIALTMATFAAISLMSYQGAIASAEGYGGILKEINRRSSQSD